MAESTARKGARVVEVGVLLGALSLLAACGGGSGTSGGVGGGDSVLGASTNAAAPVMVLSMSSDAPVAGVAALSLAPGDPVRLGAPGYLGLEEAYRGGSLYLMDADEASVAAASRRRR